jgi:ferric-dicitrate binding protein FerR (iron transport regulator)
MEVDYQTFTIDELARDDWFRQWVVLRDPSAERFWLAWLAQHPEKAGRVQGARAFLLALGEDDTTLPTADLEEIAARIVRQEALRTVSFWEKVWQHSAYLMAAMLLLVLGVGYGLFASYRRPERELRAQLLEISPSLVDHAIRKENTTAQVQHIRLEDGSIVDLYPHGSLRYPAHFAAGSREVYLSGKAFFSIAKNHKKPFWVYTSTLSTQVLGTSFLVSAAADAAQTKVEVKTGRVSVYRLNEVKLARRDRRHERAGVILTPNQQVAYAQTDERLVKSVVAVPAVLGPVRTGAFVFDGAPVAEVFKLLEKTYGLPVIYDATTMSQCYLTADLTNESFFDQLMLICKITRSTYEIVDGQIVIHSNGCEAEAAS